MIKKDSLHMQNKSLVCLLDKSYSEQFSIFIYSLLKNNPWFNYDINVFYWEDDLINDIDKFKNIYKKIIFNKINETLYEDCLITKKWRIWNYNPFYRFEIFSLKNYSKIVYMDLDMLILGDISFLFNNDIDFAGCPILFGTGMEFIGKTNKNRFNGGLLIISEKYLGNKIRDDLISMCEMKSYSGNQTPLNFYFQNNVTFIDPIYNFSLDLNFDINFEDIKVLHFIGNIKPFFSNPNKFLITENFEEYIYSKASIKNCFNALLIYDQYKKEFYDKHIH